MALEKKPKPPLSTMSVRVSQICLYSGGSFYFHPLKPVLYGYFRGDAYGVGFKHFWGDHSDGAAEAGASGTAAPAAAAAPSPPAPARSPAPPAPPPLLGETGGGDNHW